MNQRVAVLLVGNLSEALRLRSIWTADSEPYWLCPNQYREHNGGMQLFPAEARDLMVFARQHGLRLLGILTVAGNGDYREYLNEDIVLPVDHNFSKKLFQAHARFWFCQVPAADLGLRSREGHRPCDLSKA